MRVGLKSLDDAIININAFKKVNRSFGDKQFILNALHSHNYEQLREISNFYFETSGIYNRACRYLAYLYRYDWYTIPFIEGNDNSEKNLKDFTKVLRFLDNSHIPQTFGDVALKIIKNGCYYGVAIGNDQGFSFQELPVAYCRSRFNHEGFPTVEFNMKYFDDAFQDTAYRMRILKTFPKDFQKGYVLYREKKLKAEYSGDSDGWYLLEPGTAVKFNCGGSDFPLLTNAIPAIIDLAEAQELNKKKMMQKLLKIIIQKLPLDKNSELVFDVEEAADIHNNAVTMLKRAIGVDVLTTFADIDVADMSDKNTTTSVDDLEKMERGVFNEFGFSHNIFNSDSNLSLQNSIINDEASVRCFVQQFEAFVSKIIPIFIKTSKKSTYKFKILETTIYNHKELSKLYKEQTQIGYSKMLPQIALGHSQSEILAMAHFENEVLNLVEIMVPPMMSSTMSSEQVLGDKNKGNEEDKKVGRKEKEDSEKSDKTIANKESM